MISIRSVARRLLRTSLILTAVAAGAVFGLYKTRVEIPALHTGAVYASLDRAGEAAGRAKERVLGGHGSGGHAEGGGHAEAHEVVVTSPLAKDVTLTRQYVCQIHAQRQINICALDNGYLEKIQVREGQRVKKGDLMFKVLPVLYQARLDAKLAETQLAQLEFDYAKKLHAQNVVSQNDVALNQAKLARAKAEAKLAEAELNFTSVVAPFDGIVDRLEEQLGSLIKEGDVLTTLSDNSVMWVYFNVPEARYLEYMASQGERSGEERVELVLANGAKFPQAGRIGAIEAKFNNETGNIPFRADFPNPEGLLRHGQTGTVLLSHVASDAIVIPQRATFEVLAKTYAYVVDDEDVVHQREITIRNELDDIYLIEGGLGVHDKIVLEGVRQVRDGEKVKYKFEVPEVVLGHLKYKAE